MKRSHGETRDLIQPQNQGRHMQAAHTHHLNETRHKYDNRSIFFITQSRTPPLDQIPNYPVVTNNTSEVV